MPDGIYVSSRYFFTTPDSEVNKNFVRKYQARFNEYPDYMAGKTYAGIYFIKAAVERAGTVDAKKIIAAVEKEPLAWDNARRMENNERRGPQCHRRLSMG